MNVVLPLVAVALLVVVALVGGSMGGVQVLLGVYVPYAAVALFLIGVVYRVIKWAKSPVPYRIPTTCGQQKTLSWIKPDNLESPHNVIGVLKRMFLEIFLFRSLFRNTKTDLEDGPRLVYSSSKWLWLGAIGFHYAFFTILIRHFRFFLEPVPAVISAIGGVDGFFQIGLPALYLTDAVIVAALLFLFARRIVLPRIKYISLANDFFPLFLLLGIAGTGILMRYFIRVDVEKVKVLAMNLIGFRLSVPEGIGPWFFAHLLLVSVLVAYFPFSKLTHMAGVFLSPTRNLVNNSRERRHVNPWNYDVKVHTYAAYEDEFREVMKNAGLPVEKE